MVHSKIVKWVPPMGWLKCNTDGASRGNPGPSASAFCLRNHEGRLLGAKGVKIVDSSNLVAEARAISEGLDNHYSNIIIETDSLFMVNIINEVWKIPWSVSIEVGSIHKIRNLISVRVQRSLRERNILADFFLA